MGVAPAEAMAMEVPTIGSKIAGIQDVLEDFEEWMFRAGNSDDLKTLLEKLYGFSDVERKKLGESMRESIDKKYNFDNFIKSREALYSLIVKNKN